MSGSHQELVKFVREMNASGGAYHTIRLADGLVLEGDYWTYRTPNLMALRSMLTAAGFTEVEEVSSFELVAEPGRVGHRILHAVAQAVVLSDAGD